MDQVRLGVIGTGGMGQYHLEHLHLVPRAKLTAVCDIDAEILKKITTRYAVKGFLNYQELLTSDLVDAVIVATPHYAHTPITIHALQGGVHVLCEKPVAVHVQDALRMNQAFENSHCVFSVMFQFRTDEIYKKAKELIDTQEIGTIVRINFLATDWFRSQTYYNSGGWRATWKGEGGGVLLNQCPHSLDLLQWFGGQPWRITATCALGKYHHIEVEDDVTAILEYPNGATGIFVTSTGEAPGTSLLEICGDQGKLVIQNAKLYFHRTRTSVKNFCMTTDRSFDRPETWQFEIPCAPADPIGGHQVITRNFVNAILLQEPLISPGIEGVRSLEIGNAMLMSGLLNRPIDLPIDAAAYAQLLQELIEKSNYQKQVKKLNADDFTKSFHP